MDSSCFSDNSTIEKLGKYDLFKIFDFNQGSESTSNQEIFRSFAVFPRLEMIVCHRVRFKKTLGHVDVVRLGDKFLRKDVAKSLFICKLDDRNFVGVDGEQKGVGRSSGHLQKELVIPNSVFLFDVIRMEEVTRFDVIGFSSVEKGKNAITIHSLEVVGDSRMVTMIDVDADIAFGVITFSIENRVATFSRIDQKVRLSSPFIRVSRSLENGIFFVRQANINPILYNLEKNEVVKVFPNGEEGSCSLLIYSFENFLLDERNIEYLVVGGGSHYFILINVQTEKQERVIDAGTEFCVWSSCNFDDLIFFGNHSGIVYFFDKRKKLTDDAPPAEGIEAVDQIIQSNRSHHTKLRGFCSKNRVNLMICDHLRLLVIQIPGIEVPRNFDDENDENDMKERIGYLYEVMESFDRKQISFGGDSIEVMSVLLEL